MAQTVKENYCFFERCKRVYLHKENISFPKGKKKRKNVNNKAITTDNGVFI